MVISYFKVKCVQFYQIKKNLLYTREVGRFTGIAYLSISTSLTRDHECPIYILNYTTLKETKSVLPEVQIIYFEIA
jgi:hypothetical protein